MHPDILIVENDLSGVVDRLCDIIQANAEKTIGNGELFKIGLSGGSLVDYLCEGLPKINTDWSQWRFFFCDERIVPFTNSESTYGVYKDNLMTKIPVSENQFVIVNPTLSAEDAAKDYIKKMSEYFPQSLPRFDVLLLGMGPDGHTCSLFPQHPLLNETSVWISPITDSPKPPPCRITMTFPVINNAKNCIFTVVGAGKAEMAKRIWKSHEKLPAGMVRPSDGNLIVIADKAAGASLAT